MHRVTATAKALRVLDCFTPTQPELTLAQISRILNMPKSTLLNQLRTLEEAGFLCGTGKARPIAWAIRSWS
ncbi:MAG: helix-turn-helix domain-containing protein [Lawsonibacter sp.]